LKVRLSPKALLDLDGIWAFTDGRWGPVQAERYIGLIRDALAGEISGVRRGRPCDDIRRGYVKLTVESHSIFYRFEPGSLVVVRILHGRMDFTRHL
jgi:toxin ParE1/3/4